MIYRLYFTTPVRMLTVFHFFFSPMFSDGRTTPWSDRRYVVARTLVVNVRTMTSVASPLSALLLMMMLLLLLHACAASRPCNRRNASTADGYGITWTGAEYRFECDTVDALLRDDGRYVPKNNIALRGQICGDDLYLAYPR